MKIDGSKITKIVISKGCGIINVPEHNECSDILPQIKKVFEVLSSVKIKGKQYARPFILKYSPDDFYIKNISDNKYLNNQIQHIIKIK